MEGRPIDGYAEGPEPTLDELLAAMSSGSATEREAAWGACYERYVRLVWTSVVYVVRRASWLRESRAVIEDVVSDVFVGLPDAARRYRPEGSAEAWLKRVAMNTALRRLEAMTGAWTSGRKGADGASRRTPGRTYVSFDEEVDAMIAELDAVEPEALIDLDRQREALRSSADPTRRRWAEFLDLYVQDYSFAEIGERMGITEETARNWLWKIRKHLARGAGEE